jgi:hypothetical protein
LAGDLLQMMGAFGISNYLTGVMLILIGWRARSLALAMMGVIPVGYVVGVVGIKVNSAPYAASQADWGGVPMMMVYLTVCAVTFVAGIIIAQVRKKRTLGIDGDS